MPGDHTEGVQPGVASVQEGPLCRCSCWAQGRCHDREISQEQTRSEAGCLEKPVCTMGEAAQFTQCWSNKPWQTNSRLPPDPSQRPPPDHAPHSLRGRLHTCFQPREMWR